MLKFFGLSALLLLLSTYTFAQNTKGDRPVKNDRQIRETKMKTVRKKEKRSTRDIANRRLRTKNKSSANRANANYPQPSPYSNRTQLHKDKSSKPRGRVFTQSPRESRTRPWKGDVSGYPIRRIKPSPNEAARNNVYPQSGPFIHGYRKKPKEEKPHRIVTNLQGRRVGQQKPRKNVEHAWKGGVDKGPLKNQSISGSIRNVYPQKGPYVKYYRKHLDEHDKPVSNKKELAQIRKFSRTPRAVAGQGGGTPSYSRPFIQKGKKNVYWGKFSKKERPYTRDITGGPLRTRNFKTTAPGVVGTDTVKFFGRKPLGDRSSRVGGGGYVTATQGGRSWKGDVAGWRLRKSRKNKREVKGRFVFPRQLSISEMGERAGEQLPGGGYKTGSRRGERPENKSVPSIFLERDLGARGKGIKRPPGGGGSISGQRRNNKGQPILGKAPGIGAAGVSGYKGFSQQRQGFSRQGPGYSGNMRRASPGFSRNGANYSGNIRRSSIRGFNRDGVDYSGKIKRGQVGGFSRQGANYSGNIRRSTIRGFNIDGVDYSGRIKQSQIRGFSRDGVNYSGNIRRSSIRGFNKDGVNYSGNIKRSQMRGISKNGVDYSGNIPRYTIQGFSKNGVEYSGRMKRSQLSEFSRQGFDYSGNMRRSSIRGLGRQGANFAGNIKARRPEKGGGSVSGKLRNNEGQSVDVRRPISRQGADFVGNIKTKRPEKGGGSVSGTLWNNDGQAIQVRTPQSAYEANYSGKIARSRFRKDFIQNPNAFKESLKKHRPDETTYRVSGLMVKVREGNYKKKPNADKNSLPGVAPTKSSVKASEYARGMKQYWNYKHNPNSASEALNVIAPSKAMAHINDYQGNIKMHKYTGSRLHPDAQFAHGYRDNVKEERTFLMNVKLAWARLFRKSETQPENLKEKVRRPRYDKREKGLWYE